jgi:hypothetical protein
MSRSFKSNSKSYVCNVDAGEMKEWKRLSNKRLRAKTREALNVEISGKETVYPRKRREGEDIWAGPSEGKQSWFGYIKENDKKLYEKMMRK